MAAPTFIQEAETVWNTSTSPKDSGNFTTQTSDVVVACQLMEDSDGIDDTITATGTNVTLTSQQEVNVSSYTLIEISAGVVGAGGTTSVSFAKANDAFSLWFGGNALTFRDSDGIGASAKTNTTGAPSLSITTTQDNSAIVVIVGDWNAADGASRTWRTVNGIAPTAGNGYELTYFRNASHYTVYAAYYSDAGAAGAKTVGLSDPSGQKYSIVALEIKGAAGGGGGDPEGELIGGKLIGGGLLGRGVLVG